MERDASLKSCKMQELLVLDLKLQLQALENRQSRAEQKAILVMKMKQLTDQLCS